MAILTERASYASLTLLEDFQVHVRIDRVIFSDENEIARIHHRVVLQPGDDIPENTPDKFKVLLLMLWTQDVIDEYKRKKEIDEIIIGGEITR